MLHENAFWKLTALTDRQVLDGLSTVLATGRQTLAQLLAHLGEVEERRLHLHAACGSLFNYCVTRLGLSEDEACRRIEVARLARRFPVLFPPLATGRLSLSVAALLKPSLSAENALELIAAVSGKSVQQARELLAARFPSPDVASCIRKLPEPRVQPSLAPGASDPNANGSRMNAESSAPGPAGSPGNSPALEWPAPAPLVPARPVVQDRIPARAARIEPLSAARYKVQFTASAELKRKLETARDLMRHAHPSGDFEPIIERALDLLITELMKRRCGVAARRHSTPVQEQRQPASAPRIPREGMERAPKKARGGHTEQPPSFQQQQQYHHQPQQHHHHQPSADIPEPFAPTVPSPSSGTGESSAPLRRSCSYVARGTRRRTLERDGLCCSWTDEHGVRCESRAWLEYDHRIPRARGGGSELNNVRLLCRAHNRLAAEQVFGRRYIEAAIRAQRRRRSRGPAP